MATQDDPERPPQPQGAGPKTIKLSTLKACLDSLDKLKTLRRELKAKLQKEGLSDDEEVKFAGQLSQTSDTIRRLEDKKFTPLNDLE